MLFGFVACTTLPFPLNLSHSPLTLASEPASIAGTGTFYLGWISLNKPGTEIDMQKTLLSPPEVKSGPAHTAASELSLLRGRQ